MATDAKYPGWVETQWSRPTGAELDKVIETLKSMKLTLRNVPMDGAPTVGSCIFTGQPAVERIYVARAY
jgi:prolyl-tRNA synthetase